MNFKNAVITIILLSAAGAFYAWRRRQSLDSAAAPEADPTSTPTVLESIGQSVADALPAIDQLPGVDAWMQSNQAETDAKVQAMIQTIDTDANVRAFLQTIAKSEGTANSADPYRVCFGLKHTIADMSDHPAVTGEWKGEKLSDYLCQKAGYGPGCVSTAAGKYQITKPTWLKLKSQLKLHDFGPESQDAAAVELLNETGALESIKAGYLTLAISKAKRTWASLPGAGYGQPERSMNFLTGEFVNAGGRLA